MKSTVVDESLSSFKPMYCSREYQASTRLSQQYEKSTSKRCNVGDLKPKHHSEDLKLKPSPISRAARFINHPDDLPDIDIRPDCDQLLTVLHDQKDDVDTRYNLRRSIKAPTKLDL